MRRCRIQVFGGAFTALIGLVALVATGDKALASAPSVCTSPPPALENGSFEAPSIALSSGSWGFLPVSTTGLAWKTTDPTQVVEIWIASAMGIGQAPQGTRVAELNANNPSMLYQDLTTVPGQKMVWTLRHRGRTGVETMNVRIGPPAGALQAQVPRGQATPAITDDTASWGTAVGAYDVPPGQTLTRFGFDAVVPAAGSYGNLLDDIVFSVAATACDDADTVVAGRSVSVPLLVNDRGTGLTLSAPTAPAHGTVALVGGVPLYTPAPGFVGTDTFSYTVTDAAGESSSAQVFITVTPPAPPVAIAKESRDVGMTVQEVLLPKPDGGTVRLLDRDGNPQTRFSVKGEGAYELDDETGRVRFSPVAGFAGSATAIRYRVSDAYRQASEATYHAHVDAPPVAAVCASRRRMTLHWWVRAGSRLRSLQVTVDGTRTATLDGRARSVTVDLTGRPRRLVEVSVSGRTRRGDVVGTVRRYRTCVARIAHRPLPTLRLLAPGRL
jgi:CshA-type fibril repeat protein